MRSERDLNALQITLRHVLLLVIMTGFINASFLHHYFNIHFGDAFHEILLNPSIAILHQRPGFLSNILLLLRFYETSAD